MIYIRLLSWDDDETKGEGLRIVVLKRMFTLDQVEVDYFLLRFKLKADPENFVEGLRADVLPECEKLGPVQRMEIFEVYWKQFYLYFIEPSRRSNNGEIQVPRLS